MSDSDLEKLDQSVREASERLRAAAAHYFAASGKLPPSLHGREVEELQQPMVRGARLYANRHAMLTMHGQGGVVAEVGTDFGRFAKAILDRCSPCELHLFDLEFRRLRRDVRTHANVRLHEGDSSTRLALMPEETFDWIYIDGDHSYEGVKRDIEQAVRVLKPGGTLVFNDYVRWSHLEGMHYGIVPAVNELVRDGWRVVAFALSARGYPDIAVKRSDHPKVISSPSTR